MFREQVLRLKDVQSKDKRQIVWTIKDSNQEKQ